MARENAATNVSVRCQRTRISHRVVRSLRLFTSFFWRSSRVEDSSQVSWRSLYEYDGSRQEEDLDRRGPGRVALGRRPQATTAKKTSYDPSTSGDCQKTSYDVSNVLGLRLRGWRPAHLRQLRLGWRRLRLPDRRCAWKFPL